jgi:hypothetical protein
VASYLFICWFMFIFLYISSLLSHAASSSDFICFERKENQEILNVKDVEESGHSLIKGTTPACTWKDPALSWYTPYILGSESWTYRYVNRKACQRCHDHSLDK